MGGNPLDYLGVQDATTDEAGKVELATVVETTTGTNSTKAVTPEGVAAVAIAGAPDASEGTKGIAQLATTAEAQTGTNDAKIMTPLKTSQKFAAPGAIGGTTPSTGAFTGLSADGTGTVSLVSNAAALFDATGAGIDLTLSSDAGRVIVNGEEAAANAITLLSAAGGIDADAALQINIATSQNAADAMVLSASAGGIDITAAGGAAEDIDIVCTSGSVNISGGENVADAVVISAGAGGIDILATGAAGEDLNISNTGGSVNITATEAVADAINITASTGAGGITMTPGTGNLTIAGTIENVAAKYVLPTGIDYTFDANPVMQTAATTGGVATGATGNVNLMGFPEFTMESFILGTGQTIISPRMGVAGLNIALDQVDNEGAEYNFGAARLNSPYAFTIGTSAAFQMICTFNVADVSGCEPLLMGFRKVQTNNATMASYTDYASIGLDNVAFAGTAVLSTELNSGGTTNTDTTDSWADGTSHAIGIFVSAAGVVTYTFDGSAPSATAAYTFDSTDVVVPFIHFLNGSDVAGDVEVTSIKLGFQ